MKPQLYLYLVRVVSSICISCPKELVSFYMFSRWSQCPYDGRYMCFSPPFRAPSWQRRSNLRNLRTANHWRQKHADLECVHVTSEPWARTRNSSPLPKLYVCHLQGRPRMQAPHQPRLEALHILSPQSRLHPNVWNLHCTKRLKLPREASTP